MSFNITARALSGEWKLVVSTAGPNLLEIMQNGHVPIKSACMGRGTCGQCRIKLERGVASIGEKEQQCFSQDELKMGWRLSCQQRPKMNTEFFFPQSFSFDTDINKLRKPSSSWWLVCDLGTTSVEMIACDQEGVWATVKELNRQVTKGLDVMTRLEYAQRVGIEELSQIMLGQLKGIIEKVKSEAGQETFTRQVWIAGNSAMTSFLIGEDIAQLAVYPYQPSFLQARDIQIEGLFLHTLPLINSFVGGDVTAGVFEFWYQGRMSHPWLLVDVGTNTEIIFWSGEKLFVTSTPAGPAFEGSNISIGMRAENGAVINPRFDKKTKSWSYKTIGNDLPRGICGSALVSWMAESLKSNIIDEDGEVTNFEGLNLTSDLALVQNDIREFQLAKSAIQTGIAIIEEQSGLKAEDLYISGALGSNLNLSDCVEIGLFPDINTHIIGNTSLRGAQLWSQARQKEKDEFAQWLQLSKQPLELAMFEEFQNKFISNLKLARRGP